MMVRIADRQLGFQSGFDMSLEIWGFYWHSASAQ
jgi:hypothetical protein